MNEWTAPRYVVECMDCELLDTYGYGNTYVALAQEHADENPGHRVQIKETRFNVLRAAAVASGQEQP